MNRAIQHGTLVIERDFAAPVHRVFAAWADVEARKRWAVPSPSEAIEYDQADFRVGGLDVSRCGQIGDLTYVVEDRYLDIVQNERILFSESVSQHDVLLSVALVTVEFSETDTGTHLILTEQLAALDAQMLAGSNEGWNAALENLGHELSRTA